jgi:deoxyribodipyrimidine photolyase-like uncharacterized protein
MNYKAEADKIVEMFMPFSDSADERGFAIQCAIKHVEGIINELPKQVHGWHEYVTNVIIIDNPALIKWNEILNQLKQM